ncbi:ABC transporter permease [Staphylococcus gallinarum]|uniref:ABC transporter, permease protein n=1 Tax=Staphylococcus gallinarum TaxID=1293 RepID=A0A0D0RJM6_STAGA|nr:ABC transporter permease [Staphylococcus gallinarum]KIR10132.1 ABC transporter permease [Staphylococcus gallinarum]MCD8901176.1 ABC transporter permease [Staphylococcus gallinarum]MCD8910761.1 ABC transporter permease [Staphylococcus gallinarum]MCD8920155.1 ABC transporter permease [Staphylococcus gallinarum]RTX79544.1 ABC transporter permease [Staphylococcus gallinarum]
MHAFQIAKRIFKQTVRDVRTLMLLLVAPILILSLLYYIFTVSDNANGLKVGVHQISDSYLEQLHDQDIQTKQYHDNNSIGQKIKDDQLTGFIYEKNHKLYVTYANDNPTETGTLASANQKWLIQHNMAQMKDNTEQLQQQLKSIQSKLPDNVMDEQQTNTNKAQVNKPVQMTSDYLYANKDATYFDMINPILIGFFVFFFTFLISGIGLLKERTSGTLERLLASPIKRSEIIFGYIMGYGLFSVIQTVVVVMYAIFVLHIAIAGSIWLVLATTILTALVALTFGILLSTFASSEFQMIQFIPLVIVPQVLFAGLIPIQSMNTGLQYFAHIMPLFYTGNAMQSVMIKGFGIDDVYLDLCILFAIFVVLLILNIFGMKRYRKV